MSKHLAAHPEFVKAFVVECFSNGFNEKQASELLDTYAKAEFYTTDKDFKDGVDSTLKQAGVLQALGNLGKALGSAAVRNPGISVPVGAGIAGGALLPDGTLSDNYTGGAGTGALAGTLLGLLATRGRGLGGSLSRIGTAMQQGGLGRTTAKELGKLVTNPTILKGTAAGAGAGLAATATGKVLDQFRLPDMNPNTGIPWYMQGGAGGGNASNAVTGSNPFDLPPEIMARARGGAASGGAALGGGAQGPLAQLQSQNADLTNLNNKITQLENSLPSSINPSSYMQRQSMQSEIDNLKMRRNELANSISQTQQIIDRDKFNISALASEKAQQAALGSQSALTEFENLRRRAELANQGWKPGLGVGNSPIAGTLMGLYNKMTGAEDRLAELEPIYRGYQDQAELARRMQELAR
jgi:hypothetical protein